MKVRTLQAFGPIFIKYLIFNVLEPNIKVLGVKLMLMMYLVVMLSAMVIDGNY